jgi:multidrug resistance efflux pump
VEILLLGIYSFFAWLVFFKFKWLPWNIVTQVITITIPIFGIAMLILCLNVFAPSSHDVRVLSYVVPIVPRVTARVTEVPIDANRPIKKGDVLFKLDPAPFQIELDGAQANLKALQAKLLTAAANQRGYEEQLKSATGKKEAVSAKLDLARRRVAQYAELSKTGAGNKFDYEQAQADLESLTNDLESATAAEDQAKAKLSAKTKEGEQDEVAQVKAQIAQAEAQIADAQWKLDQTVMTAPGDGTVVNLALKPGAVASQLPMAPSMSYILDEDQWIVALFAQNEVREVEPGNEGEIALRTLPGRIIKCKVDSVIWATAQGQLPISGNLPQTGFEPVPAGRLAVRLRLDGPDKDLKLAAGARGQGAIYTNHGKMIHIIRKVILRVGTKLDWLILKLH